MGDVVEAFERICRAYRAALTRAATSMGLSQLQAAILETVYEAGEVTVGELAGLLGVSQPTVSDALKALESKGLLRRKRIGRRTVQTLTDKGRLVLRELQKWKIPAREGLQGLDLEGLYMELLRYISNLQRSGFIEARVCLTCKYYREGNYCALLKKKLDVLELRVNCPDYKPLTTPPP